MMMTVVLVVVMGVVGWFLTKLYVKHSPTFGSVGVCQIVMPRFNHTHDTTAAKIPCSFRGTLDNPQIM